MENFKNKTVIVTGSAQGIGLEIAKLFISNGANVVINSRNDNDKLNEVVGNMLLKNKFTLSVAESCTGGYLAKIITDVPGSSKYFKGGIIAYSNDVKISDLGVSEKILNKKGAVSSDVAKDMAKGIRQKYNTNIGLSTTGIAGPEGGSIDKPVGLVYIGLSTEDREESFKFNFSISRKKNKLMFSQGALNILREYLLPL